MASSTIPKTGRDGLTRIRVSAEKTVLHAFKRHVRKANSNSPHESRTRNTRTWIMDIPLVSRVGCTGECMPTPFWRAADTEKGIRDAARRNFATKLVPRLKLPPCMGLHSRSTRTFPPSLETNSLSSNKTWNTRHLSQL